MFLYTNEIPLLLQLFYLSINREIYYALILCEKGILILFEFLRNLFLIFLPILWRHSQVGSLTGAVHLLKNNADVQRQAQ